MHLEKKLKLSLFPIQFHPQFSLSIERLAGKLTINGANHRNKKRNSIRLLLFSSFNFFFFKFNGTNQINIGRTSFHLHLFSNFKLLLNFNFE
ncbi:hypothetical protein RchiOBHm_Chr6g0280411 [Rosa chinensis]|uniref:Uncharacterized protein n=1 Tax=Rosa chinensis TaxID=74649 RepID=A0A2P6PTB2_ROSCH|nr:hypothetical protein RchiOBHm_Chr6g0280411 [Rosa chinensis]